MSSVGPTIVGTGADDAAIGNTAWTNPGNITADDASYATVAVSNVAVAHYAKGTNCGFSIPANATITGVVVDVKIKSGTTGAQFNSVKLCKAGTITGTSQSGGESIPTTEGVQSYGSSSNLWGTTLTPSDVNNSGFGVGVSVIGNASGQTVSLNDIAITIHYTVAAVGSNVSLLGV